MGLFGKSKAQRRNERRIKKSKRALAEAEELYRESRGELDVRGDELRDKADMSVGDRFGDTMGRAEDQINDRNATSARITGRALAAGGGDLTGGASVLANRNVESGNKSMGAMHNKLALSNQSINTNYDNSVTSVLSNVAGMDAGKESEARATKENAVMMELKRKQANKQFWSDLAGTVLGTGGQIASAGILGGD